jgi:hypothetical protein
MPFQRKSVQCQVALVVVLVLVTAFSVSFSENLFFWMDSSVPPVRVRDFTITYYRAAEHSSPPLNTLDPYDSFLKDANGDLIITPTGTNIHARSTQSVYQGYMLKTQKGNPIVVYQETPSRRQRHKSNCHGYTFLAGDYWLMGPQIEQVLNDNDWAPLHERRVRRGDVAVYRNLKGAIVHTARVVGRDDDGHILVNSKNGFDDLMTGVHVGNVDLPAGG